MNWFLELWLGIAGLIAGMWIWLKIPVMQRQLLTILLFAGLSVWFAGGSTQADVAAPLAAVAGGVLGYELGRIRGPRESPRDNN